jgi:para-nitrobenzyl esterase
VVATRAGRVLGFERRGVQHFKGIPYATPPRGDLRFRAPERPKPWEGVRPAQEFGPSAPQGPPALRIAGSLLGGPGASQDCLYLNVWTPAADRARRPVLVWIHGGAFVMGSGSSLLYSGSRLASRGDAVVVTLNYRLGALGFLDVSALERGPQAPPANLGILDQIAALEWVRDNVEQFGGDPENVTLFGESAGAMSVATLLAVPRARGLFHRAILQSGAAENVSTREQAREVATRFLFELGVERADVAALGRVPMTDLIGAQQRTIRALTSLRGVLPWQPSVDGVLIPEPPLAAVERGAGARVPMLIGTNREEWKLFLFGIPRARSLREEGLRRRLAAALPEDAVERALAAYGPGSAPGPASATPHDLWIAFQSDRVFHVPAERLADAHARHVPQTFRYLFDYAPRLLRKRLGVCHGLEIPFVFGTLRARMLAPFLATSERARRLSERMQDAWVAFARSGNPEHEGLPGWPEHRVDARDALVLRPSPAVARDPFARARRFWEGALLR